MASFCHPTVVTQQLPCIFLFYFLSKECYFQKIFSIHDQALVYSWEIFKNKEMMHALCLYTKVWEQAENYWLWWFVHCKMAFTHWISRFKERQEHKNGSFIKTDSQRAATKKFNLKTISNATVDTTKLMQRASLSNRDYSFHTQQRRQWRDWYCSQH